MMRTLKYLSCVICIALMWMITGISVYAAEGTISFASDAYEADKDDLLTVGVYITSDDGLSGYNVLLRYDTDRLEYLTGADISDEMHGILTLERSNLSSDASLYWLQFKTVSGGEASIEVTDAVIYGADGEEIDAPDLKRATINVVGEDITSVEQEEPDIESDNNSSQEAAEAGNADDTDRGSSGTNAGISRILGIVSGGSENSSDYRLESDKEEDALSEIDEYYSSDSEESDGETGLSDESAWYTKLMLNPVVIVLIIVAVVFIVIELFLIVFLRRRSAKKRRRERLDEIAGYSEDEEYTEDTDDTSNTEAPSVVGSITDIDESKYPIIDFAYEEKLREERGEPVIRVCDVTMEYKLYQNQASGLKEYLIQVVKQEVTYKRLFALYHVSFDVFKGEVVGIIGTNGSGKSTILKIVSGALDPTDGEVDCDRSKLQILTLGTGFDMELTGRENIYLNGAIIGYTREFIDEHFDEIVAFAELGDFMDEKVKNYSSGMVSRLGFAIATAGDAAEILILDEVLSVGDQFFQKKSLARIKEMIHGGSTVLMVSHGMNTILEHCTKVVWIEKGQLRMIGKPEEVCAEYKKLGL